MIQAVTGSVHQRHGAGTAVTLLGIGTAVPPAISQEDSEALAKKLSCRSREQELWTHRIYSHSGVSRKGSVLLHSAEQDFYLPPVATDDRGPSTSARMARYVTEAPQLGARAARDALQNGQVAAEKVTHLITVSCTGFSAPGLDHALATLLELSMDVHRTHIGFMGCHGAFNALAVARNIARADPDAVILVCCVELCSLHYAYGWDPEKMVANALFADGAAAIVVRACDAPSAGWQLKATASRILPQAKDAMTWRIGDHGFEMTLSSLVPQLISDHIKPWCQQWLGDCGKDLSSIAHWAVHPGGPKILATVQNALNLPQDALSASYNVLRDHGNMSSATILFILRKLAEASARGPCVAIGFGPGLAMEGLLLECL